MFPGRDRVLSQKEIGRDGQVSFASNEVVPARPFMLGLLWQFFVGCRPVSIQVGFK